ncbi:GDP-mannose 4,6-dehydratase [Candidatus Woesearchaeota archaeon]|nr:GDP-mannose 4,6-dehydratase [Candidatus Woesearchaeota archaeon]
MTKALITGGCGFIGVNLVEYLLNNTDWELVVLDDLSNSKIDDFEAVWDKKRVKLYKGDARDVELIDRAIENCDYVVSLAALVDVRESIEEPVINADVNVMSLVKQLMCAANAKIKKLVFSSSGAALGDSQQPMKENLLPQPMSPYGASKLAGEAYCSAFAEGFGLPTVALRFSNVYGPRSYGKGGVIPKFIQNAINGQKSVIFGDGSQTRDFVYVEDICRAIFLALTKELPNKYELIQLGTGREMPLNTFVELLKKDLSAQGIALECQYAAAKKGEIYRNYADISKAREVLGYEPNIGFEEGLKKTVEWFVKRKA